MTAFTLTHVAISLVGIVSGVVVAWGLVAGRRLDRWTAVFLATTILTSVTGFFFPFTHFTPGHAIGIVSLVLLTVAVVARYPKRLAGGWRAAYVISAVLSLYFNVFVLIVQSFQKVSALAALAPTQTEPPFVAAQLVTLAAFVALTVAGVIRFRPETRHQLMVAKVN